MRALLAEKPAVGIAIAVILLVAVGIMALTRSGSPSKAGSRYYYNIQSGERIVYKADEPMPPITLPSGDTGVLAHVFTCGACNDEESFVGYLEQYTDEYKRAATVDPSVANGPVIPPTVGHLIAFEPAAGEQIAWVPMTSPQGRNIINRARSQCGGSAAAVICLP